MEGDIIQKVSETAVQKEDLLNVYLKAYEHLNGRSWLSGRWLVTMV